MSIKKYFVIFSLILLTVICTVGFSTWIIASPAAFDAAVTDNINDSPSVTSVKLTVTVSATAPRIGQAFASAKVYTDDIPEGQLCTTMTVINGATDKKEEIFYLKPGQYFRIVVMSGNIKEGTYNDTTIKGDVPVTIVDYGDTEINVLISNQ